MRKDYFNGDVRALSRAISSVENRSPEGRALLRKIFQHAGSSRTIGITGSPGAGKSSLVNGLAAAYRRENSHLAVVAVDPSSPFTGGAILGDRIRMNAMSNDPGIFIRSMATRGNLGGLAASTGDVVRILDAAGRDPILIETVGVGQDEVEVAKLADVSVVVLVPGMGDDVQTLKAGIMEIADIFVINKCDRQGVENMERSVLEALSLAHRSDGWTPPVVKTVATEGRGIEELKQQIDVCLEHFRSGEQGFFRRREAARRQLEAIFRERLVQTAFDAAFPAADLSGVLERIARHEEDPYAAVDAAIGGFPRIDHVGIAVRSIADALKLYEGALGLKVSAYEDVKEQGVRVAMLPVGDSRIELLEPVNADSPVGKFLEKRGEGIHHIAIRVNNIEAALERFKASGVRLIDSTPRIGAHHSKIAFIHPASMGGVLLELVERD